MTLEELLKQLKNLKYKSELFGKIEDFNVIYQSEFNRVENLIRQFALDNHDEKLGLLQAKVYAYEQIIANSNFAPIVTTNGTLESTGKRVFDPLTNTGYWTRDDHGNWYPVLN